MFSIGVVLFLYLNCFLHAVIYLVHCALSLIILFYICACCDARCFKKCLFILVCRSKSSTGLMLHVVQYSTQNKISMSMSKQLESCEQ